VNGKLGEKSVHNLKGVLSSVFALAVFEWVMDRNPCAVSRSTSTAEGSSISGPRAIEFGTLLWTPKRTSAES
jgi:hypothetical protein